MFTQLWETFAHTMNRMGRSVALSLIFLLSAPLWVQSTARAEVIISEILANPESGTEWIELATTGEETVNISNFTLYDTVSSPSLLITFPEPTVLLPDTASIFEISGSKLNNTGDTLVLKDLTLTTLFETTFGPSTKGLSWQRSLHSNDYQELLPTPGELIQPPTPSPKPSLSPSPTSLAEASPTTIHATHEDEKTTKPSAQPSLTSDTSEKKLNSKMK